VTATVVVVTTTLNDDAENAENAEN